MEKVHTPNLNVFASNGFKANTFSIPLLPRHSRIISRSRWIQNGGTENRCGSQIKKLLRRVLSLVFWPGSEVKIEGQYPTHYLPYNRSLSFEKRIDYLCTMLEQDDPPSFLAAYFNEPDHSGHKFGPNSPEIKSVIRRMDNVTGYLLESLRNRGLLNQVRTSKLLNNNQINQLTVKS